MGSTLSLENLVKDCDNIYEAIIVLGKRARQINDEQKAYIEKEAGIDDSITDDDGDDYFDPEAVREAKVIKLPKPTQLAIDELIAGKIQFDYGDDVEGEQAEK